MAVVATTIGRVDVPPALFGQPNQPGKLSAWLVSVTIQAADYSSGVVLTNLAAAVGATTIAAAVAVQVKIAAGTTQFGFSVHDITNNKLRFFSAITNQTTATDYTAVNGDIWTVLVVGV